MAIAATVAVVAIVGIGRSGHRPGASEIVPSSLAQGETSPVDLMNDANWTGQSAPVQASLDDALVDQEGASPALGKHRMQGRAQPVAPADVQTESQKDPSPRARSSLPGRPCGGTRYSPQSWLLCEPQTCLWHCAWPVPSRYLRRRGLRRLRLP